MSAAPSPHAGVASRLGAWVLDTPRWKYLTALFTLLFLRTGVTLVAPAIVPIAQNPYRNPFTNPHKHYLYWSWLGPAFAHQVGATNGVTLTLFYLAFAILCALLLCNAEFLATIRRDTIGRWALLWCLVPWMFVWAGRPLVSAIAYDLLSALHHLFGISAPHPDPRFPL